MTVVSTDSETFTVTTVFLAACLTKDICPTLPHLPGWPSWSRQTNSFKLLPLENNKDYSLLYPVLCLYTRFRCIL